MAIRERRKGVWEVSIDAGRNAKGKRVRRFVTVHGGKRVAEAEEARLVTLRETGMEVSPGKLTMAGLFERWLADVKHRVGPSTYLRYEGVVTHHLGPTLGHYLVRDLRPAHVSAAYAAFLEPGKRADKSKKALSNRTVHHHHTILHQVLEYAVRLQLVGRNVTEAVDPPRPEHTEMRALDPEECERLMAAAEGTLLALLVRLALMTGAREGELLALRWTDLDIGAGLLRVTRNARRFKGEGVTFGATKTHRSARPIALSPDVVETLKDHHRAQSEQRLRLGPGYADQGLIFAMPAGAPFDGGNLRRTFKAIVEKAKLGHVRFHDLRHSTASLLFRAGVPAPIVAAHLGHARVDTTLNIYTHLAQSMQQEAATAMAKMLPSKKAARTEGEAAV